MALRKIVNDENNILRSNSQLALKTAANTSVTERRNALGDLVNRTDKSRIFGQQKSTDSLLSNTSAIDLKNVKPRVDTHWNGALRKPLTRSASTKATLGATSSIASGPKLVRAQTTESAILSQVKIVKKKSNSPERAPVLKRQESTLTRTKIRTVTTTTTTTAATKIERVVKAEKVAKLPTKQSNAEPTLTEVYGSHSNNLIGHFNDLGIDDGDEKNPLLVSEYVNDIYAYLFSLEKKYAIRGDHLEGQREVVPRMRTVLVDWINEVHLQYHFAQETFHMAVSIIDRYLQTVKTTSRKNLQLVGVTALFIASKYEELYPPEVKDFVYITDYTYTKEQVLQMEKHILKKLKFELGCPTSIHFLRRFSKAAQSDAETHVMGKYFIELSCINYKLSEYLPSEIAAASLFIALCVINAITEDNPTKDYRSFWTAELENYSTYSFEHLMSIMKQLIPYIFEAPASKTNNVCKKYETHKLNETTTLVKKSGHVLNEILALA